MSWNRYRETPLHQAVLEEDLAQVGKLREAIDQPNLLGLTPLDLAKLLDKERALEILSPSKVKKIRVMRRHEERTSEYTVLEFEKLFGMHYLPYLRFPSYHTLRRVQRNCPLLLRHTSLGDQNREWTEQFRYELDNASVAPLSIRWIDPIMGYGVFADWDLEPSTYVGEYTGVIRRFYRLRPDHNAYCFHYPTRFFSWNYYMVDAQDQGNELRFVNHSDTPNLQPICLVEKGLLHLCFVAKHAIPRGTELTFDYGSDYWRRRKKVEYQTSRVMAYRPIKLQS